MKIDQKEVEKTWRTPANPMNDQSKSNDQKKLIAKAGQKLGISKDFVHRILRKDLGLKPYKFKKRQKLAAEAVFVIVSIKNSK